PDEFYLPDLHLTSPEQVALATAAAAVEPGNGTLRDALIQLGGMIPDAPGRLFTILPSMGPLDAIFEAQVRRATATFTYRGEERTVEPWAFVFQRGWWYVVGWDRVRAAQRVFRVDRMTGPVSIGEPSTFTPPPGFDPRAAVPAPWQLPGDDSVEAEVVVDATVAQLAVAELGSTVSAEWEAGGSVRLRVLVSHRGAFRAWVLGLLDHAEVVGPP